MTPQSKARAHQERMLRVEREALRTARRKGRKFTSLAVALGHFKFMAATDGVVASSEQLYEQGFTDWPDGFAEVSNLAHISGDGSPLVDSIARGTTAGSLGLVVGTEINDVARQGASIQVAATPRVGYVRMVEAGACSRCVVQAGRWFRWNQGFLRHPRCRCTHIPAAESDGEDMSVDPYAYFESLSGEEQDRVFTKAGAEALREGADMGQVVNARSGMSKNGQFTTTGTTSRGRAGQTLKPGQKRMTPEHIFEQANGNREKAVELLKEHAYILPEGQVSSGAIRRQREGSGQLGRGGTRKAAAQAVEEARRTGVRDPGSRYTMTAAERRLHDSRLSYESALREGENVESARKDYMRWFQTNGEVYTR